MPADANAFQRLIDRVLFPGPGAPEDASSRPLRLLQALLAQNVQARNYAQRVLLERAAERPDDVKRGGVAEERLRSLLELWPAGERETLSAALERQSSGASTMLENIQGGLNNSSMISDVWSPSGRQGAPSGYSTPPRGGGGTPNWGPPLSDSPPPPREQFARQVSNASPQVALETERGNVRYYSQPQLANYPQNPQHVLVRQPTFENHGGVQVVDSTATTMPIQFSRESRHGRLEIEASTTTVRRETASSLDAWMRKAVTQQPAEIYEQQLSRSRSLPAQTIDPQDPRHNPQLVLDFGPSSSSGDDKRSQARGDTRRTSTMSTVVESSRYPDTGKDVRRLMQNNSTNSRSSSSDGTSKRFLHDDVRPWSRPRRQNEKLSASKPTLDHDSKIYSDRIKDISSLKNSELHDMGASRWDSWHKLASKLQRATARSIFSGCRSLNNTYQAVLKSSRLWQQISMRFMQRQVRSLSLAVTSSAAESARAKCVTARWQGFALGNLQLRRRDIINVLSETNRIACCLRRLLQTLMRRGLRAGFQGWRHSNSLRKHADVAASSQVKRFQNVCERAQASGRASAVGRFIVAMRQCGQERQARRESASKTLVAWMENRLHSQLRCVFVALQGVVFRRTAKVSFGAERLVSCIEKLRLRKSASAMSSMHGAVLSNLTVLESTTKSQASSWAIYRCLREAMRLWLAHHRRLRRLSVSMGRISRRSQQWAWRNLYLNCMRKKCDLHLGDVAAKMERVHSDSQMNVEAARLEFEAQLRVVQESLIVAQRNENEARKAHTKSRLQRIAWGVWNRAREQDQNLKRLVCLIGKQMYRQGFTSLRVNATRNALTYLHAQVDCFDQFVSRRTALSSSIFQKCTSEWSDAFDGANLRLILGCWRQAATNSHHVLSQRKHACRVLVHIIVRMFRQQVWAPWTSWQCAEKQARLRFNHEVQLARMHQEQENLQIALRATKLQTEATVDNLGHQVREQEQINWTVCMEAEAMRVLHVAYLWKAVASHHRTNSVKQLSSVLWQAHVLVARSKKVAFTWRQCAKTVVSNTWSQLRGALCAAASTHARKNCAKWERSATTQKARHRLVTFVQMAHAVNTKKLVGGVVCGFTRLADARRRMHSLVRIRKSLELRVVMRRLHRWSQHHLLETSREARQGVALSRDRYGGARLMRSVLGAMLDQRQRYGFWKLKLERERRRRFVQHRSAERGARKLETIYRRHLSQAFGSWRTKSLRLALRGLSSSVEVCRSQRCRWISRRYLMQIFRTWNGIVHGPRHLCAVLDQCARSGVQWAWQRLRYYSLRCGQEKLRKLYVAASTRRRRISLLKSAFVVWNVEYRPSNRIQRTRVRKLHRYMALRIIRMGFVNWHTGITCQRKLRRFAILLRKAPSKAGFATWQTYATKTKMSIASNTEGHLRQAMVRQRNECERLMERRSLECAQRTATALLHAWRCAAAAEAALIAQRSMAARSLARVVGALCRTRKQGSMQRWRAGISICGAEELADSNIVMCRQNQRLDQVRQGVRLLQSFFQHRRNLAACQALNGTWRNARWEATVRALDASTLREQRKLRADCDSLRTHIRELEQEKSHFEGLEATEADRNSEAQEEVKDIMRAVRRERLQNEATIQTLELELQRSKDSEVVAMERVREAENHGSQELATMQSELREARARSALVDADRRNAVRDLAATRNELHQANVVVDESDREGRFLARTFDEKTRSLEEQVKVLDRALQKAERDAETRVQHVERDSQERAKLKATEMEERARLAEIEIQRMVGERERASEMQASMADEQDRAIRRLEELLKEQGDELRRERRDHSKGLEELRSSASLSESKTQLFEEQVSALRQQLHREQSEVRASERAWAGDRAALLAAVANCAAQGAVAGGHPLGRTGNVSSRRKASSQRVNESLVGITGSAGSCRGSASVDVCPWHGNRPKPLANRGLPATALPV